MHIQAERERSVNGVLCVHLLAIIDFLNEHRFLTSRICKSTDDQKVEL